MSRIEFRHLGKRYAAGAPWTIHEAHLGIEPGEFCVFVGPSGCGKSTLLRMVAGLEDISVGELLLEGRRANDLAPARRNVAMVFQSYALYPHMNVFDNMAFGLRVAGSRRQAVDEKVRRAAESLQLTPFLERLPRQLSGGQRQRVAIGRAIVKEPDVFLFDEPLSNLDAALRVQTRLEIARLHREIGRASMIYVTHDQVEAMTLADRIVLLRSGAEVQGRGSVAQFGTPMELYHRPRNRFAAEFIGSPKMNLLPARLLSAGPASACVDFGGTRLPVAVDARRAAPGTPVSLGLRPEHVLLGEGADQGPGATLDARVLAIERLGDASLLYLDTGPGSPPVTVRTAEHAPQAAGEAVRWRIRAEHCHLFEAASGEAFERTVETPR